MVDPISARIVVESGGMGGVTKDPDNSTKMTNRLLRLLIVVSEQNAIAKILKGIGGFGIRKGLMAMGAVTALGVGIKGIVDPLKAINPLTGELEIERATTLEDAKATADAMGITLDEAQKQADTQQTITTDTKTTSKKIKEQNETLGLVQDALNEYLASIPRRIPLRGGAGIPLGGSAGIGAPRGTRLLPATPDEKSAILNEFDIDEGQTTGSIIVDEQGGVLIEII